MRGIRCAKRLPGVLMVWLLLPGRGAIGQGQTVRLRAVGDIMLAGPMGGMIQRKGRGYPFAKMRSTLRAAADVFGNCECCIATCGSPIPKQFNFRACPDGALALRESGFTIVNLANNHAWDYGRAALLETVRRLHAAGVQTVGAGPNAAAAHRLCILQKKGLRIGFLAYLGLLPALLPESSNAPCLSMASVEAIRSEVMAARPQVDVLIVSLHAGQEGDPLPTARQKAFAEAAIDAGADLVIGHHPHVVQPLEMYKGKPICYSLGNFVFSTTGRGTGAMLDATLSPHNVQARLIRLRLYGAQPQLPGRMPRRRRLWASSRRDRLARGR
ncbi:MAG TPA: CapA family protein [Chthonomonadaceae bacterium]|nr:CapA family protein [Chthonomonadaceae bacterium]